MALHTCHHGEKIFAQPPSISLRHLVASHELTEVVEDMVVSPIGSEKKSS